MESVAARYLSCGEQGLESQSLVTMTYIFQKLSAVENQRLWVMESGAHRSLVKLLHSRDSGVVQGALLALTAVAQSPECKKEMGELPVVETLLVILQEHDLLSKKMGAELLRLLSPVPQVRIQVMELGGVPVLLSLLHGPHVKLLWTVSWVLVQLCEDPEARVEIRSWGGVQQLLRLLSRSSTLGSDTTAAKQNQKNQITGQRDLQDVSCLFNDRLHPLPACCTALTEMSLDDSSALHIVQENGVYIIAKLILPEEGGAAAASLQEEKLEALREGIRSVDQSRPPLKVISGYSILEHLGTGAFGSVFKVQKQSGQNLLALKEVNLHNPAFGKDKRSRDSNVEKIISELTIIKEQAQIL
ncbi:Serine/threonine-protein kinase Nek10 [Oryzias melastigma]|uniref:Serine/threonine-protein kinase Nek10 n=1 Tax=Oryzias melastigma TaxID=30732 RepID=A0A834FDG4_ORYME|nr:Serine/threonine-protein kinase Nek10 [Oryzias melastigma]